MSTIIVAKTRDGKQIIVFTSKGEEADAYRIEAFLGQRGRWVYSFNQAENITAADAQDYQGDIIGQYDIGSGTLKLADHIAPSDIKPFKFEE